MNKSPKSIPFNESSDLLNLDKIRYIFDVDMNYELCTLSDLDGFILDKCIELPSEKIIMFFNTCLEKINPLCDL